MPLEMMEMENEKWLNFFDQYRSLSVLWDTDHEHYKNKEAREYAWAVLLETYKEIDPESTVENMKHKVSNMRGCYRRELRKIAKSERRNAIRVHVPHLWYFDQLNFLKGQPNISSGIDSPKEDDNSFHVQKFRKIRPASTPLPTPAPERPQMLNERRNMVKTVSHQPHMTVIKEKTKPKDDAAIYSEGWACTFRKLSDEQKLYAKKIIDEVLLLGQLKKLTIDTAPVRPTYLRQDLVPINSPSSDTLSAPLSSDQQTIIVGGADNTSYDNPIYDKKGFDYSIQVMLDGQ